MSTLRKLEGENKRLRKKITDLELSLREVKIAQRDLDKENARLLQENAKLQQQALTDHLTSISNRRAFDQHLLTMVSIACRLSHPLTVAIIDVDNLKTLNDRFGHRAGDGALRMVAKAMKDTFQKETDAIFRIGGDEFAVVCLGTSHEETSTRANKLSVRLERDLTSHCPEFESCNISVSFGCATLYGSGQKVADRKTLAEKLVIDADSAMYSAKGECKRLQA